MLCSRCSQPCNPREQDLATNIPLHVYGAYCARCCAQLGWTETVIIDQPDDEDYDDDDYE